MHKFFLATYRKTRGKIHQKLSILEKCDLYLNQFSNKKEATGKPERLKRHPIWAAHPGTHLSTKYLPGGDNLSEILGFLPHFSTSTLFSHLEV